MALEATDLSTTLSLAGNKRNCIEIDKLSFIRGPHVQLEASGGTDRQEVEFSDFLN